MTVYVLVREDQSEHGFVDASIVGLFRSQDEATVLLKSSIAEAREQGRSCAAILKQSRSGRSLGTSSHICSGNHRSVSRRRRSALPIEQTNERFGVPERVMDGMMIVLRSAKTLPLLSAAEITDQPCVEIGDASSGMPERVRAEIAPKVKVDPLEVVRRVVRHEHHRHPRSQPIPELPERVLRAIHAMESLDSTALKGVDVNGAKLRHVAD